MMTFFIGGRYLATLMDSTLTAVVQAHILQCIQHRRD